MLFSDMSRSLTFLCILLCGILPEPAHGGSRIIQWSELDSIMHSPHDTTYILNFWATWCKPCVKEIPYFEEIGTEFKDQRIKIYLVSLDFSDQNEKVVIPFIERNSLKQEVLLLDDTDYDKWISKVDPGWQGAIPATLILNNSKKIHQFYQKEFSGSELRTTVKNALK
jgi:thiol-disulfide isomerase/thioredoxin